MSSDIYSLVCQMAAAMDPASAARGRAQMRLQELAQLSDDICAHERVLQELVKAFDLKAAELLECCARSRAREDEKGRKRAAAESAEEEKAGIEPAAAHLRAGALLAREQAVDTRAALRSAASESAEQELRAAQQALAAAHNSNICMRKQSRLSRAETAILPAASRGLQHRASRSRCARKWPWRCARREETRVRAALEPSRTSSRSRKKRAAASIRDTRSIFSCRGATKEARKRRSADLRLCGLRALGLRSWVRI